MKRDMSTPENRAFWADVKAASLEVEGWPGWKRGESGMIESTAHGVTFTIDEESAAAFAKLWDDAQVRWRSPMLLGVRT